MRCVLIGLIDLIYLIDSIDLIDLLPPPLLIPLPEYSMHTEEKYTRRSCCGCETPKMSHSLSRGVPGRGVPGRPLNLFAHSVLAHLPFILRCYVFLQSCHMFIDWLISRWDRRNDICGWAEGMWHARECVFIDDYKSAIVGSSFKSVSSILPAQNMSKPFLDHSKS